MTDPREIALRMAHELVAGAVWHDSCCTWMTPLEHHGPAGVSRGACGAGPALYEGTGGIGLVLAEIAAATGDRSCAAAAAGALRATVANIGRVPVDDRAGLFTGLPGIAVAVSRGAVLLADEELVEAGREIAVKCIGSHAQGDELVAGRAGVILGLLALGGDEAIERAGGLADEMVSGEDPELLPTGLAHGPSGPSHALLELWALTGRAEYREAAAAAWAAEDAWFDPVAGNWPRAAVRPVTERDTDVSLVQWCHGAPGIGLARHRAWRLTGDEVRREEAATAIRTTAAWVRAALDSERGSDCLCHGLAGLAEIIAQCADAVAGEEGTALTSLARETAEVRGDAYVREGQWVSGMPAGDPAPGLMVGLAGLARFHLRRALPDLPSLLLPQGRGWVTGGLQSMPNSAPSASVSSRVARPAARSSTDSVVPQVLQE